MHSEKEWLKPWNDKKYSMVNQDIIYLDHYSMHILTQALANAFTCTADCCLTNCTFTDNILHKQVIDHLIIIFLSIVHQYYHIIQYYTFSLMGCFYSIFHFLYCDSLLDFTLIDSDLTFQNSFFFCQRLTNVNTLYKKTRISPSCK